MTRTITLLTDLIHFSLGGRKRNMCMCINNVLVEVVKLHYTVDGVVFLFVY